MRIVPELCSLRMAARAVRNTFIELVQRLSSIELIVGIATSLPPFFLGHRGSLPSTFAPSNFP